MPDNTNMTAAEAAVLLGVTPHTIRYYIRTGRLAHSRPYGLAYVVSRADVRGLLREFRATGRPKPGPRRQEAGDD